MEDFNIFDACTYYIVDLRNLDEDIKKKMAEEGYDYCDDEENAWLTLSDVNYLGISLDNIDWNSGDFDEENLEDILNNLIGEFPHYLVFASGCTWNGRSGYKFCNNIKDTVLRNYEVSITVSSIGADFIICNESSHDVPMGSTTYILGLSEKEYDKLSEYSFKEIEEYVYKKIEGGEK